VVIPPNLLLLFGGVTERVKGTKFTQWMDLNKTDIDAKELKYIDLPTKYVWNKELKIWKKAKRFCNRKNIQCSSRQRQKILSQNVVKDS
jgi:hypothetical protein